MTSQPNHSNPLLNKANFAQLTRRGELDVIEIQTDQFFAAVLLQGAQLIEFRVAGKPWIWLSELAQYQTGVSVRGGIPVCWPWFGEIGKNPQAVQELVSAKQPPAHGFARSRLWELTEYRESTQEAEPEVSLKLELLVEPSELWSGSARLSLGIELSASALALTLNTQAMSAPLAITQALHTYFATDCITDTQIQGLEGAVYHDALDHWTPKTQQGGVCFTKETDRVYIDTSVPLTLITPSANLKLQSSGRSLVVWNPWIEKAQRISQFADEAYLGMFCVETANVLTDLVSLEKTGDTHSLSLRLCCADMETD